MADDEALEALIATPQQRRRAQDLLPLFYPQIRRLARRERRRWDNAETLQTTALVNEAYLKLRDQPDFYDSQHFLRSAAIAMRHALISSARERLAEKRGGGLAPLPLEAAESVAVEEGDKLLLDVAEQLHKLAQVSPRLVQVVECRFYAGYSEEETAEALGLTARTVRRDWVKARAWLQRELSGS